MNVQEESKPYDDINITPMLDLSYVLLIIFIIMCTAGAEGIKVNIARPSLNQPPSSPSDVKPRVVTIDREGKILLDRTPMANFAALEQALKQYKQTASPASSLIIRGDGKVSYQYMVSVIDIVDRLNIERYALATAASQ